MTSWLADHPRNPWDWLAAESTVLLVANLCLEILGLIQLMFPASKDKTCWESGHFGCGRQREAPSESPNRWSGSAKLFQIADRLIGSLSKQNITKSEIQTSAALDKEEDAELVVWSLAHDNHCRGTTTTTTPSRFLQRPACDLWHRSATSSQNSRQHPYHTQTKMPDLATNCNRLQPPLMLFSTGVFYWATCWFLAARSYQSTIKPRRTNKSPVCWQLLLSQNCFQQGWWSEI